MSLLLIRASKAQTTNSNEFWISTSTNTANLGTLSAPYDCSTQTKFDSVINGMPAYSTIHALAGTYLTSGWLCPLKSGQKFFGSGIDVTILKLATDESITLTSGYNCTNIEICDMTVDANYSGGSHNRDGIILYGKQHVVRRVKAINCAHYKNDGGEAWGITINAAFATGTSDGNIIEGCEVSQYAGGSGGFPGGDADLFAIGIGSGYNCSATGIIRDNRVLGTLAHPIFAFGCNGHAFLFEGNYVENVDLVFHSEPYVGWTNVTIVNNWFRHCGTGLDLHAGANNLIFAFNNIEVADNSFLPEADAFIFNNDMGSVYYTNIFIFGNNITCASSPGSGANRLIYSPGATCGLVFANNSVDSRLTNYIVNCPNLSMYNNTDSSGNYLSNLNIPTIGGVPVTQVGLGLIGSVSKSTALMNLGLPGGLYGIVTNSPTQPLIFNTNITVVGGIFSSGTSSASYFSGNGGGLTGITAQQVGAASTNQLPQKFVSIEYPLTNMSYSISTNHGFASQPQIVRWVLVCKTNEIGYQAGDEVSAGALVNSGDNSKHDCEGANSSKVFFTFSANGQAMQLPNKTNPVAPASLSSVSSVISNWKLKCYATYLP